MLLRQTFYGNTLEDYIWFGGLLLAALLLARPASRLLCALAARLMTRLSGTDADDELRHRVGPPLRGLLQAVLLYWAINRLHHPFDFVLVRRVYDRRELLLTVMDIADHLFLIAAILLSTTVLVRVLNLLFGHQIRQAQHAGQKDRVQILPLMKEVAKLLVWATSFFTLLGLVFHVNVPALITGLGIGGVAIALAAKESVENLFASFTILADNPFDTDDTIRLGSVEGVVERIGFRSTRLRNPDGAVYIVPNKKLIDELLENLSRRRSRRVRVSIPLRYGTSAEALQSLTEQMRQSILRNAHDAEQIEIHIEGFGEDHVQLLVSFHLPYPLESKLQEVKQRVYMELFGLTAPFAPVSLRGAQSSRIDNP